MKRFSIPPLLELLVVGLIFSFTSVSASENVGDLIACVLRFGSAPFALVALELEAVDSLALEVDSRLSFCSVPAVVAMEAGGAIAPSSLFIGLDEGFTTTGVFSGPAERKARFCLRLSFGIFEDGELASSL